MKKYLLTFTLCGIGIASMAQATSSTRSTTTGSQVKRSPIYSGGHGAPTYSGQLKNVHTNDGQIGGIARSNSAGAPVNRDAGTQNEYIREKSATIDGRKELKSQGIAPNTSGATGRPSRGTAQ